MIRESTKNDIRLIELDDGKVNFLSLPLRVALLAALQQADDEPAIRAVVLSGRGPCFCAGMNVEELEAGTALDAPSLHGEILDCLSAMRKPVVAAIHGGAHGGGLELALGCHYRVALAGAEVSLPEILVGVMPGARGTQHLPRAIGVAKAADMILNGRRVAVERAAPGLIDEIYEDDLIAGAATFALEVADRRPLPRLQDIAATDTGEDLHDFMDEKLAHYPGIAPVISSIRAAVDRPYAEAVAAEFAAFSALKDSVESKLVRAGFLAKLKEDAARRRASSS